MKVLESKKDKGVIIYKCVGCGKYHIINTNPKDLPAWGFNGSFEKPTLTPSILMKMPFPDHTLICHHFVNDGFIQFLDDCNHPMAGQTVEMPEIDHNSNFYKAWEAGGY